MKKKICLSVMAVLLLLQPVISAEVLDVSYSKDNPDYIVISGDEKVSADTKVTVSVFQKGKTYADLDAKFKDESDVLAFAGVAYADEQQTCSCNGNPQKAVSMISMWRQMVRCLGRSHLQLSAVCMMFTIG